MAIQDLKANLDLKQNLNIYATCKQFDNLNLILSIFDNSLQVDLSNYDVRLRAMKADNVPLIQEHIGIGINGNVVNIQADEQLTTTAGNTPIELQFIDKTTGYKKATFNLVLVVVASAIAIEASISKATYTLLKELEDKLDQASDFFENIDNAIEANNNLINSTDTANETKEALDNSNTTALATKSALDTSNTNATNTRNALDTLNTTANNTKDSLDTVNTTGQSLLDSLETFEQEHADVTDISNQLAGINADLSENTQKLNDIISIPDNIEDETDVTTQLQTMLDLSSNKIILIPHGKTFLVSNITMKDNTSLKIEGALKHKDGSTGSMIKNYDQVNGNVNIKIFGTGVLDGNKSNTSLTNLIDFEKVDKSLVAIRTVYGNNFPASTPSAQTTGCIYIRNSTKIKVFLDYIENYSREAVWLQNCEDCEVGGHIATGDSDSWSGLQISGTRNKISKITSLSAGASGIGIDSSYSTVSDCIVKDNSYFNGFNFGHAGNTSDYTVVTNCHSINAGYQTTNLNDVAHGFNIYGGKGVRLENCTSIGSKRIGFNIIGSSISTSLSNCKAENCGEKGFNFSDSSTDSMLDLCTANTCGIGLNIYGGKIKATNCDFKNNTTPFLYGGTPIWSFSQVKLSNDNFSGGPGFNGVLAGGTITVNNGNITTQSRILLQPSTNDGQNCQPYVKTINDGNFIIGIINAGTASAYARYFIL